MIPHLKRRHGLEKDLSHVEHSMMLRNVDEPENCSFD